MKVFDEQTAPYSPFASRNEQQILVAHGLYLGYLGCGHTYYSMQTKKHYYANSTRILCMHHIQKAEVHKRHVTSE